MNTISGVDAPVLRRFVLLIALAFIPAGSASAHLELVRTAPEADATVHGSPAEIRLWFSEAPQVRGVAVRLVDSAGDLVSSTEAAVDQDPRQVFIRPETPLRAGSYTVQWRVIAQDGHAMNGVFAFAVHAE